MDESIPWADMDLWQRTAACYEYFKKAHAITEKCWRAAEGLGKPTPERTKAFQTICDEISGPDGMRIAAHVVQWLESENPYHIDAAVLLCHKEGFPITPTLQAEVERVATLRLLGKIKPQRTAGKVLSQSRLGAALETMANLTFEGLTVAQAASKVAFTGVGYKASTLEKYYERKIRPKLESDLFLVWNKDRKGHEAIWKPLVSSMPDTPEHQRGERR